LNLAICYLRRIARKVTRPYIKALLRFILSYKIQKRLARSFGEYKIIRAITQRGFIGLIMTTGLSLMATTGTCTTTMLCVDWLFWGLKLTIK